MIAWFLIAISTIAFFAYIAVSGVQTVDTTATIAARADTLRRSDTVAEAILERASAPMPDGVIYAPAGVPGNGEYLLPEDLQPAGITTFGSKLQYCPMGAPLSAAATETVTYPGGSYGIRTITSADERYVIEGRPAIAAAADQNIIAFVITQLNANAAKPGCGQITQTGDSFTVPNGVVRVVRRSTAAEIDSSINTNGANWYVTPDGTGDGLSWSNPGSLTNALAAYRSSLGGSFRIRFYPGTYTVEGNPLDQTLTAIAPKKNESTLILIGQSTTTLNLGNISLPGNLILRDVQVPDANITVDNGTKLTMERASASALIVNNGSYASLQGGISLKGRTNYAAALQFLNNSSGSVSGTLGLSYVTPTAAMLIDSGSSAAFSNSVVTMQPADSTTAATQVDSLVQIRTGGTLISRSSTFNHNGPSGWTWRVYGKLAAFDTSFLYNAYSWVGIQPWLNAEVTLNNIVMRGSTPPQNGLAGQNVSKMNGYGDIYSSQRCWSRDDPTSAFRLSPIGVAGDTANVSANETWVTLTGVPSSNQIKLHQAQTQRNIERQELRNKINNAGGTFNCKSSSAVTWTYCSADGGTCNIPSDAATANRTYTVRYGTGTAQSYIVTRSNIPCNSGVFGDPAVGSTKTCSYAG
jgi:hypothetical protein